MPVALVTTIEVAFNKLALTLVALTLVAFKEEAVMAPADTPARLLDPETDKPLAPAVKDKP